MPELPEVETTKNGLSPFIVNNQVKKVTIYKAQLRWPIPDAVLTIKGQHSYSIERRAKYLLWHFESGTVVMHLGMSGTIRIVEESTPLKKHDHFEVIFSNGQAMRFNDPRRFGAILWQKKDEPLTLLNSLGPEPLTEDFNAHYLKTALSKRKAPIKNTIMDNKIVVGVGNIYASESLFLSGIHPERAANSISLARIKSLVNHIKIVLEKAIAQGGTTLKDFNQADGKPGYFAQQLNVYGRENEQCLVCSSTIKRQVIGQRASFYCKKCQT